MKKPVAAVIVFLVVSAFWATASAQTDAPAESPSNWIFGAVTVVVLAVFIAIIAYAAFKLLRKWSG